MVIPPAEVNIMEDRLAELETRAAFQENTIQALNDVIVRQQDKIDWLEQELLELKERIKALSVSPLASEAEEIPPPHY